ncbi:hypothetical protein GCM10023319_82040 [Nocardia iowensis]
MRGVLSAHPQRTTDVYRLDRDFDDYVGNPHTRIVVHVQPAVFIHGGTPAFEAEITFRSTFAPPLPIRGTATGGERIGAVDTPLCRVGGD